MLIGIGEHINILNVPSILRWFSTSYAVSEHQLYLRMFNKLIYISEQEKLSQYDKDFAMSILIPFVLNFQERLKKDAEDNLYTIPLIGFIFEYQIGKYFKTLDVETLKIQMLLNKLKAGNNLNPSIEKKSFLRKTQEFLYKAKKLSAQFFKNNGKIILGGLGLIFSFLLVGQSLFTGGAYLELWSQFKVRFINQVQDYSILKLFAGAYFFTWIVKAIAFVAAVYIGVSALVLAAIVLERAWSLLSFKFINKGINQHWGVNAALNLVNDFKIVINPDLVQNNLEVFKETLSSNLLLHYTKDISDILALHEQKCHSYVKWKRLIPISIYTVLTETQQKLVIARQAFEIQKTLFTKALIHTSVLTIKNSVLSESPYTIAEIKMIEQFVQQFRPNLLSTFVSKLNLLEEIFQKVMNGDYFSPQPKGLLKELPSNAVCFNKITADIHVACHVGYPALSSDINKITQYQLVLSQLKEFLLHRFDGGHPNLLKMKALAESVFQYNPGTSKEAILSQLQSYLFQSSHHQHISWYSCFSQKDLNILQQVYEQYQFKVTQFGLCVDKILSAPAGSELNLRDRRTWSHNLIESDHENVFIKEENFDFEAFKNEHMQLFSILNTIAKGLKLPNVFLSDLSSKIKQYFQAVYNGSHLNYIDLEMFMTEKDYASVLVPNILKRLLFLAQSPELILSDLDEAYFLNHHLSHSGLMEEQIMAHPFWLKPWSQNGEKFFQQCVEKQILSPVILQDYRMKYLDALLENPTHEHSLSVFNQWKQGKSSLPAMLEYLGHQNKAHFDEFLRKFSGQFAFNPTPIVSAQQRELILMRFELKKETKQHGRNYERSWLTLFELALANQNNTDKAYLFVRKLFSKYQEALQNEKINVLKGIVDDNGNVASVLKSTDLVKRDTGQAVLIEEVPPLVIDTSTESIRLKNLLIELLERYNSNSFQDLISKSLPLMHFCLYVKPLLDKIKTLTLLDMASKVEFQALAFFILFYKINQDKPLSPEIDSMTDFENVHHMFVVRKTIKNDWNVPFMAIVNFMNKDNRLFLDLISILSKYEESHNYFALLFKHVPKMQEEIVNYWTRSVLNLKDAEAAKCFAAIKRVSKLPGVPKPILTKLEKLMDSLMIEVRKVLLLLPSAAQKIKRVDGFGMIKFSCPIEKGVFPPPPVIALEVPLEQVAIIRSVSRLAV